MKRLFATMVCDVRLQFRNGFYYAAGFVVVVMALLLNQVRLFDLALLLLRAAFQPLAPWQLVYGVLYAALWVGLLYLASWRAFDRSVIARQGSV